MIDDHPRVESESLIRSPNDLKGHPLVLARNLVLALAGNYPFPLVAAIHPVSAISVCDQNACNCWRFHTKNILFSLKRVYLIR
jgi:hypothetical protein